MVERLFKSDAVEKKKSGNQGMYPYADDNGCRYRLYA